jgi:ABC-2 type transport system ATP-binding protein
MAVVGRNDLAPGSLRLRDVSRSFRIVHDRNLTLKETVLRRGRGRYTERWALRNVDLDIRPGQAVGVVGENGSGKSTLLKVVAGILPPQTGEVQTAGTLASMLELGAGFHPDFNGRENVYMNGAILGLSEQEVADRFDDIVAFAELADSIDMPVRTYSSGMTMRLAFAIASHVNPQILLLDEVLAVGDEAFQRKCMGRMYEFRRSGGTLLFVSHDAGSVERICDRAILLADGAVVEDGTPADVLNTYHRRLATREGRAHETAPSTSEITGGKEWGTGRVRISRPRLEGPNGLSHDFVSGDPIAVVFDVETAEPVPQPCFGTSIWTVDGQLVWGTNTKLDAFSSDLLGGRQTVRFAIDELPLHEGRFMLQVAVISQDHSEIYHWMERCLEFNVFQQATGIGVVRITGRWSVAPSVDEPSLDPEPRQIVR